MFERFLNSDGFLSILLSGNNYFINKLGVIKDNTGIILENRLDSNNEIICFLSLWGGYKAYKVSVLVALTFKKTKLPYHRWYLLDVFYLDNNKLNLHPANLVWKFPEGGLLHNTYLGFAYIPCFTGYVINNEGLLLNAITGKVLSHHFDTGYAKFKITPDIGPMVSTGRHRLMCLAWLPYSRFVDKLVTNHLNGIPGDDRLSNLEWTTRLENNKHAISTGLRGKDNGILMRDLKTGIIKEFLGFKDCSKYLKLNPYSIKFRLMAGKQKVYPGLLQFKFKSDPTPWRDVENPVDKPLNIGYAKTIKIKKIDTDEIQFFSSFAECSNMLGIPIMTTHRSIKLRKFNRPIHGYDFKLGGDKNPWPTYTQKQIDFYLENPIGKLRAISVFDNLLHEEIIFNTFSKLSNYLELPVKEILLAYDNKIVINNRFLIKNDNKTSESF
jgi:hypothetical protein